MDKELLNKIIEKEGDYLEWIYTTKNGLEFKCEIKRHSLFKCLNGYVTISEYDKFKDYNNITNNVIVHGGITYERIYNKDFKIGFDCNHYDDLTPNDYVISFKLIKNETYKDMSFVKKECESLAEQISILDKSYNRYMKLKKII